MDFANEYSAELSADTADFDMGCMSPKLVLTDLVLVLV